ncbi:hypothetical protein FRC09_005339, partial [Ceratobasidium sp. 395]
MFHTPPQPSTPYMEDPTAFSYSSPQFPHSPYGAVPQQYWSQAQVQQFEAASRARDDRQYITEDQRREVEMRFALDSSPQNLVDFFNPALGPHFHPGPPTPSDHAQTFHPSAYDQNGSGIPYLSASYYNPGQLPATLPSFGVPAYANYGSSPYLSVPSQRRPVDDDGASVDAPTPESVAHVDSWLQAGPFPPLHEDPNALLHEPPQASTSSSA